MANKRQKKKHYKLSNDDILHCCLCNKVLLPNGQNFITGKHGVVCHTCLRTGYIISTRNSQQGNQANNTQTPKFADNKATPQWLVGQLNETIAGQDEAKRAIALAVWKQQMRAEGAIVPASHILLYGPTGCGKTYLTSQAAKLAGLPFHVFDASTITEAGYKGRDAADILKDYATATKDMRNQQYGIILLDEIDKLAANGAPERQVYRRGDQHSLLKLLEGVVYEDLDSSKLLFVLAGAFPGVEAKEPIHIRPIGFNRKMDETIAKQSVVLDDFIAFGMERELMGRVPGAAPIHPLTEEDLLHILLEKKDSVFLAYKEFFAGQGVTLTLPDADARVLARRALALGTGARALRAELDKVMEPLVYQLAAKELQGEVSICA